METIESCLNFVDIVEVKDYLKNRIYRQLRTNVRKIN